MNKPSPPTDKLEIWERINNSVLVRFLLLVACGWVVIQLLAYFEGVIVIFTFATILAFLLSYPVQWLKRFVSHKVAVTIVFLFGLILIGSSVFIMSLIILSQGQQLVDSVTNFLISLEPLLERLETFLQSRNLQVDLSILEEQLRNQFISQFASIITILQALFTNFITFIFIAVVGFFMLLEGRKLWIFFLKIIPKNRRIRFTNVMKGKFLGFFRGQLLLALFLTTTTFIVFLILKVPFAVILSLLIGILDFIPGIGATLGVSLITLITLSQGVGLAVKVLITCLILQQIQDNLIAPRIMQGALNLNPVVVFFALLVGGRVAGLLGIFISIPIAGVIVALLDIEEMKSES